MEFTLANVAPIPTPVQVRLIQELLHKGVTMQVCVNGKWSSICTLRTAGTLALWDVGNKQLKDHGFIMDGSNAGGDSGNSGYSVIRTHIQ